MHYIALKGVANMNYSFDVRMKKFGTKFGKKQQLQKEAVCYNALLRVHIVLSAVHVLGFLDVFEKRSLVKLNNFDMIVAFKSRKADSKMR